MSTGAPDQASQENVPALSSTPSRADWAYLGLSALAVVASAFKAPRFPNDDPALFEYFGWAMLHGRRLYTDLLDVKLPGIYLINAFWQLLFGGNYALHTAAEAAVTAATIVLFALLLRRRQIPAWALGTFLFAVFFSLPFREFDYAEHYAVFFIIIGLYLSARGWNLWAGGALALAATFWIPSVLTCIPILLQPLARRERIALLGGLLAMLACYLLAMLATFGPQVITDLARTWTERVGAIPKIRTSILEAPLGAAIGAQLLILLLVVRRPASAASRFALIWAGCALLGTAPSFFENYFLPLTPALAMAIASFGLSRENLVRRPIVALAVFVLIAVATQKALALKTALDALGSNYVTVGAWIRSSVGSGATIYTEDYLPEVYLAARADMPDRSSLLIFSEDRLTWSRTPRLLVFGPKDIPPYVRQPKPLFAQRHGLWFDPICRGRTGVLALYALRDNAGAFECPGRGLMFGSRS